MFYMSGGGKGSAPKPPNPKEVADAQYTLNKRTSMFEAQQNRFNQSNPFGDISWTNTPIKTITGYRKVNGKRKAIYESTPNWTQKTTLSAPQQNILNNQQGIQQGAGSTALGLTPKVQERLYQPVYNAQGDMADAQAQLKALPTADLATRQHVEESLMNRLNPSLQQDEAALRNQLANQGLAYGSEAYNNAMRDMSQRTNDARLAVVGQGGQEMQRNQDMNLSRIGQLFGAATDRQGMDAASRNQALAELSALIQQSGSPQMPTFGGTQNVGGIAAPDLTGLTASNYQSQVAGANANTASKNQALAAALQAGGTIAGAQIGK